MSQCYVCCRELYSVRCASDINIRKKKVYESIIVQKILQM